ncbi:MAG: phage portal protein [Pseudomonadota bacterium]
MAYFFNTLHDFFFSTSPESRTDYNLLDIVNDPNIKTTEFKQENYNNPIVVKCLSMIIQSINALSYEVHVEGDIHMKNKIERLLLRPNHYQLGMDFTSAIITNKLLYGNAYIVFEDGSLYVLNSKCVRVSIKDNDIIYDYDNGAIKKKYYVSMGVRSNILHIKNTVRDLGFLGESSLSVAQPAIDLYNEIFNWNRKVLSYNSQYSFAISLPNASASQFNLFKSNLKEKYGEDKLNAILLPHGADIKVLAKNPSEMGFADLMKSVQGQIGFAFGVPQGVIDMTNITYSNVENARQVFWDSNILPETRYLFTALSEFLSSLYNVKVNIVLSDLENIRAAKIRNKNNVDIQRGCKSADDKDLQYGNIDNKSCFDNFDISNKLGKIG